MEEYKYSLFWPYMTPAIQDAVMQTLHTRWLGQGPKVDLFEHLIEQKFRRKFAITTNAATSALDLAYHMVGLQPGDEVIVPVLTCTATNIPLVRRGVKLVFADIDPDTLCINKADVANKITTKTKAIVGVNLGGIQCDLDDHMFVPIIIDSAQGIGLTNGDYCVYSFQAIKHFNTGDGGLLFTPDEDSYKRAKRLRWFGIDREHAQSRGFDSYKKRQMTYDIEEAGYKYQMNDIAASMGIAGLADWDKIYTHRKVLFERYKQNLAGISGIKIVEGERSVYWLCTLLVEARDSFAARLKAHSIETNLVQLRNDMITVFGGKKLDLPHMNELEDKYISIPLHTNMNVADVDFICSVIKEGW